jgi:hypothetical protein
MWSGETIIGCYLLDVTCSFFRTHQILEKYKTHLKNIFLYNSLLNMFIILHTIWKLSYIYGVPIHCIYKKFRECNNGYFPSILKIDCMNPWLPNPYYLLGLKIDQVVRLLWFHSNYCGHRITLHALWGWILAQSLNLRIMHACSKQNSLH